MNFGLPNSMISAIYKTFVYHHYLIISTNFFQYTEAKKNTNSHLPLSLIKLFFADWDHKVIPCEFFAAVWISLTCLGVWVGDGVEQRASV